MASRNASVRNKKKNGHRNKNTVENAKVSENEKKWILYEM